MSFAVTDKEIATTIEKMENGNRVQSPLISNEPTYLNHKTLNLSFLGIFLKVADFSALK